MLNPKLIFRMKMFLVQIFLDHKIGQLDTGNDVSGHKSHYFPIFFSPLRPFLIEGMLASTNFFI